MSRKPGDSNTAVVLETGLKIMCETNTDSEASHQHSSCLLMMGVRDASSAGVHGGLKSIATHLDVFIYGWHIFGRKWGAYVCL